MNKILKKKANSYRKLTYKQRVKNKRKTIMQLHLKTDKLNYENEMIANGFCLAYDIVGDLEKRREQMRDIIAEQQKQIERLQSPWWKRGIRCK